MFDLLNAAIGGRLVERLRRAEGQAMTEYVMVLLLVAVAVALVGEFTNLGTEITTGVTNIVTAIQNAGG